MSKKKKVNKSAEPQPGRNRHTIEPIREGLRMAFDPEKPAKPANTGGDDNK